VIIENISNLPITTRLCYARVQNKEHSINNNTNKYNSKNNNNKHEDIFYKWASTSDSVMCRFRSEWPQRGKNILKAARLRMFSSNCKIQTFSKRF